MSLRRISPRYSRPRNSVAVRPRTTALLGLVFVAAMGSAATHAAISSAERKVLVDLYNDYGGSNWYNKASWTTGTADIGTECNWGGVTCDAAKEHVIKLDLHQNNLKGGDANSAPLPFKDLTELTELNLRLNYNMVGPFPDLAGLAKLTKIDLGSNKFTGPIAPLASLTNLVEARLNNNQFTGGTPDLSALTQLTVFDVTSNQLDGSIAPLAAALEKFYAANNQLSGPIPDLTGLTKLSMFSVENNQLTAITAMANLPELDSFIAFNNKLSGPIPSLAGLPKLRDFRLHENQLSGSIPDLTGLAKLDTLHLHHNQLSGQIPSSLTSLPALRFLQINHNQLVGSPPMPPSNMSSSNGSAVMCPNPLRASTDENINLAWDKLVSTANNPWETGCTGSYDVTPIIKDASSGEPITDGHTGTISPSEVQILPLGGSVSFTLTPANGYHLQSPVTSNCKKYDRVDNVVTVSEVDAYCFVNVVFAPDAPPPTDGVCGSDNGKTLTAPPTNLCSVGAASTIAGTGPWTWSCAGVGTGATAQCSAQKAGQGWTVAAVVNGAGGTAIPATQSVANDTVAHVTATPLPGYALKTASGCGTTTVPPGDTQAPVDVVTAPVMADCTVTLTFAEIPVNGVCGADDDQTLSSTPTHLCSAGTPSVVAGAGPWTWSCAGLNGGTTAQCSAQYAATNHATVTHFVSVTPSAPRVGDNVTVSVHVGDAVAPATLSSLSGVQTATAREVLATAIPAGTVTVSGGGASCIATLDAAGNGQCHLSFTAAGTHQLTATYPGSATQGHLPSSAVYAVTVTGGAQGSSTVSAPFLDRIGLLLLGLMFCGGVMWRRARS